MSEEDRKRPSFISEKEESLRYDLALGKITVREFWKKMKRLSKVKK